jgi:hypothetical protein
MIQHFFTLGMVPGVCAALMAVQFGSIAATKRHWHREDIYSACIRPNRNRVKDTAVLFATLLALAAYVAVVATGMMSGEKEIASLTATVGGTSGFLLAQARGRRIYSESVRQAGYPE